MDYFDLHCDTIYECRRQRLGLAQNALALDLNRGASFSHWIQTFAFWITDDLRGDQAYQSFLDQFDYLTEQIRLNPTLALWDGFGHPGVCQVQLAVEGGAVLGGKLERIEQLKRRQVSLLTLTWNGENELASGAFAQGGMKPFGFDCVSMLEQAGIVIDVSHLNDASFSDLCHVAREPFVATHSNARAVCRHPRNLTDGQIQEIQSRSGLVGLNFYPVFVCEGGSAQPEDLLRHIDHFLALGCEDSLAFGSDFDGAELPAWLDGIEDIAKLHQTMVHYYGAAVTKKIFFENANRFFTKQRGVKS